MLLLQSLHIILRDEVATRANIDSCHCSSARRIWARPALSPRSLFALSFSWHSSFFTPPSAAWSSVSPRRFIASLNRASRRDRSVKCIHVRAREHSATTIPNDSLFAHEFIAQKANYSVTIIAGPNSPRSSAILRDRSWDKRLRVISTRYIILKRHTCSSDYARFSSDGIPDFHFQRNSTPDIRRVRRDFRYSIISHSKVFLNVIKMEFWNQLLVEQKRGICARNCFD